MAQQATQPSAQPILVHKDNTMETVTKPYEIMLVLKPTMLETAVEKKLKELDSFLNEIKGEVSLKEVWGKKSLAYRIKSFDEGIYAVYNLRLPGTALRELDEHLRIDNDTLRHLVVSISDDYTYSKYDEVREEPKKEESKHPEKVDSSLPTEYKSSKKVEATAKKKEVKKPATEKVDEKLDEKLDQILKDDKLDF